VNQAQSRLRKKTGNPKATTAQAAPRELEAEYAVRFYQFVEIRAIRVQDFFLKKSINRTLYLPASLVHFLGHGFHATEL
jgi:hypothetical protein